MVERARTGDRAAANELLSRHYDRIHAVCRRIAGNDADAADGCQEALMAIVRGLDRFDGRSSFSTWSYRVATNACLDELRRRQRRPIPTDDATIDGADADAPFDRLADRQLVDAALNRLPDEFRIPVVMRDMVGMNYDEIAEALDWPPGTVRSRIARGRAKLLKIIGNQEASGDRHSGEPHSDKR